MTSERARAHFALMWGERARVTSASVTPKTTTISWEYANSAGRWRYEIIYCARTSHCLLLRFFFSSNFASLFPMLLITRCVLQSKQKPLLLHFIPWDATRWFKTSKHQLIYNYRCHRYYCIMQYSVLIIQFGSSKLVFCIFIIKKFE